MATWYRYSCIHTPPSDSLRDIQGEMLPDKISINASFVENAIQGNMVWIFSLMDTTM
jgi:hypothetical protein